MMIYMFLSSSVLLIDWLREICALLASVPTESESVWKEFLSTLISTTTVLFFCDASAPCRESELYSCCVQVKDVRVTRAALMLLCDVVHRAHRLDECSLHRFTSLEL